MRYESASFASRWDVSLHFDKWFRRERWNPAKMAQDGKEHGMIGEPVLVMLVEDNIDHAELVLRTLEEHRIANKVRHFLDGQSALDYLYRRGEFSGSTETERPQVILLDLRLPRVDGMEVLKTIKEDADLKSIPVVVLTTSEAEKDVAKAYYNHANSYLVKPVGFEDFRKLMDDLGFYWLGWNTNPVMGE
jgi:CheY-like chemotaxis protein